MNEWMTKEKSIILSHTHQSLLQISLKPAFILQMSAHLMLFFCGIDSK